MRLACTDRRRDRTGQWVDAATTYLDVNVPGANAAALVAALAAGDLVVASGHLTQRTRERGQHLYTLKAENVGLVPNRSAT